MTSRFPAFFVTLLILFSAAAASAQTSAFTYQGKLTDGPSPANGTYQMQFALYSALTGGSQIGSTQTLGAVTVAGGEFTVPLDFGAAAFDGSARYVEISVKKTSETNYTLLAPRQPVTSAPYAVRSLNAANVEVTTAGGSVINAINAAANVTISSARLGPDVVKLKPAASQTSTATVDVPLLDLTGNVVDGNNNQVSAGRFRMKHDGSFGIFSDPSTIQTPLMQLNQDAGFLLGGQYNGDASGTGVPAESAGTRLVWYPGKASFRAGYVNGTQWDAANIGSYSTAFGLNTRSSGDNSFAAGRSAVAGNASSIALGEGVISTGAGSVALGYGAHTNARQGSFVFADHSVPLIYDANGNLDVTNSDFLRAGVNHSANWRVSGGFRIFTSSNLSTGVTLQSGASVSNWGQSNAVISTSTGALLTTGGVWTNASSRDLKANFTDINSRDVLHKVLALPIQTWNYKTEGQTIRHIGPMAQDFYRSFSFGDSDRSIGTVDADGVALAAIQGLNEEFKEQTVKLKAENDQLKARLDEQQKQLDALKALVCAGNSQAVVCH